MPQLDRDQTRFVELAKKLCGDEGWQRKFARVIGLSHQLVGQIAAGDRAVTDNVKSSVATGMLGEIKRLRGRAVEITKLLADYEYK